MSQTNNQGGGPRKFSLMEEAARSAQRAKLKILARGSTKAAVEAQRELAEMDRQDAERKKLAAESKTQKAKQQIEGNAAKAQELDKTLGFIAWQEKHDAAVGTVKAAEGALRAQQDNEIRLRATIAKLEKDLEATQKRIISQTADLTTAKGALQEVERLQPKDLPKGFKAPVMQESALTLESSGRKSSFDSLPPATPKRTSGEFASPPSLEKQPSQRVTSQEVKRAAPPPPPVRQNREGFTNVKEIAGYGRLVTTESGARKLIYTGDTEANGYAVVAGSESANQFVVANESGEKYTYSLKDNTWSFVDGDTRVKRVPPPVPVKRSTATDNKPVVFTPTHVANPMSFAAQAAAKVKGKKEDQGQDKRSSGRRSPSPSRSDDDLL